MPRLLWKGNDYLFQCFPFILLNVYFHASMYDLFATFFSERPFCLCPYVISVCNKEVQVFIMVFWEARFLFMFQFGWWLGDDLLQVYRLWQEFHQVSETKSWQFPPDGHSACILQVWYGYSNTLFACWLFG